MSNEDWDAEAGSTGLDSLQYTAHCTMRFGSTIKVMVQRMLQ